MWARRQTAVRLAAVSGTKAIMPSLRFHIVLSGDGAGAVTFRAEGESTLIRSHVHPQKPGAI